MVNDLLQDNTIYLQVNLIPLRMLKFYVKTPIIMIR